MRKRFSVVFFFVLQDWLIEQELCSLESFAQPLWFCDRTDVSEKLSRNPATVILAKRTSRRLQIGRSRFLLGSNAHIGTRHRSR